jgi:hypothetical protein
VIQSGWAPGGYADEHNGWGRRAGRKLVEMKRCLRGWCVARGQVDWERVRCSTNCAAGCSAMGGPGTA